MAELKLTVMISSTAQGLDEHRTQVREAIQRLGMDAVWVENLPDGDPGAVPVALRMVRRAEVYLGILGNRYGSVPDGYDLSVTELAYNHAIRLGKPCLICMAAPGYPIPAERRERGEGAAKLEQFKDRLKEKHAVRLFKSAPDLSVQVIQALALYRTGDVTSFHEPVPVLDEEQVERLEDLAPAIELYQITIGLELYEEAFVVFCDRLFSALFYTLGAYRQQIELLGALFPDGLDALPRLKRPADQSYTLTALALAWGASGQPGRAAALYRRCIAIDKEQVDPTNLAINLCNLSHEQRLSGAVRVAEVAALHALQIARDQWDRVEEGRSLYRLGTALAARGVETDSAIALRRSLRIWQDLEFAQAGGQVAAFRAMRLLWLGDPVSARQAAERAWALAHAERVEADFIRAARLQGAAALGQGDLQAAEERLHHALTRARAVHLVEEELPSLVALAKLRRRQARPTEARELLEGVWEPAECGP